MAIFNFKTFGRELSLHEVNFKIEDDFHLEKTSGNGKMPKKRGG